MLGESRGEDDKLHKLFLAHFGGFGGCDLRHTSHAALHSGGRGGVLSEASLEELSAAAPAALLQIEAEASAALVEAEAEDA